MERVSTLTTVRNKVRVEFDSGRTYLLKKTDLLDFPLQENAEVDEKAFHQFVLLRQFSVAAPVFCVRVPARRPGIFRMLPKCSPVLFLTYLLTRVSVLSVSKCVVKLILSPVVVVVGVVKLFRLMLMTMGLMTK